MKKLLALLIIVLAVFFIAHGFWTSQLSPISGDKITKKIIIVKGENVKGIADQLKKENLIKSAFVFSLYTRLNGLSSKLSAGTFELSPSMTTYEIVKILAGKPTEVWVTLIEGWRIEEMADEINSKFQIPNDKFLEYAKEGYMFPDTYLFPHDVTVAQVVKRLKDTFDEKFTMDLKSKIKAQGLTENEGIILASIVEREARSDKARTDVASILLKRIKIGMGLNADATIQYALGYQKDEKSWWKKNLTDEDKMVKSPYNTYLHSGLPPTPICNPGIASLQDVANADSNTPYLYYYHDFKGVAHYAKTLEEHNENVTNYP